MQREMIDAYIAEGLKEAYRSSPRVPRQRWSERHTLLILAVTLAGLWCGVVLGVALLVHR